MPKSNKQPYYHRAVILFTATADMTRTDVELLLQDAVRRYGSAVLIADSIECEEVDAEPGNPADLM